MMLGEVVDTIPNFGPPSASMAEHGNFLWILGLTGKVDDEGDDEKEGSIEEDAGPSEGL